MKTFTCALASLFCLGLLVGPSAAQLVQQPTPAQQFLIKQANCDYAEIQMGELAQKNAQSDDVKNFAKTMVDEHDKCRKDLLNQFKDLKTAVVSTMDKKDKEMYDDLAKRKGADFDRAYMDAQVKRHEDAVKFLKDHANDSDANVKAFAQHTLKSVEDHLKRAQDIQKKLK